MPDNKTVLDGGGCLTEDEERLKEEKEDLAFRVEIRYRILRDEIHDKLMDLITEAIENDRIQINSIEDFVILAELDLLLLN